jgi:protein TonB
MNQDYKSRFVEFLESLIGITKTNLPDIKSLTFEDDKNKFFTEEPQIQPEFPGGQSGWIRYLERTLNKQLPLKNGATIGKYSVIVTFIVEKDGSVSDIKAKNDPGYGTKDEAIRVISRGPKWKPAIQNGRIVVYRHQVQIEFEIF